MTQAEKLRAAYYESRDKGRPSALAYDCAYGKIEELGGTVLDSSNNHCRNWRSRSDYPTLIVDFPDGSQARLMYGGVTTAKTKHWTRAA